jgi:hypothetical protein
MSAANGRDAVLATLQTTNRVTAFLVQNLPDAIWHHAIPGASQRTVQMLGRHSPDPLDYLAENYRYGTSFLGTASR